MFLIAGHAPHVATQLDKYVLGKTEAKKDHMYDVQFFWQETLAQILSFGGLVNLVKPMTLRNAGYSILALSRWPRVFSPLGGPRFYV